MQVPEDLKYRKTHEWVRVQGGTARVGVTDHAQQELNDVVYVELPEKGREVAAGDTICVIESTKAAADVYAPLSGTITEVNRELDNNPALVNSSPYGDGWLFEIQMKAPAELDQLLSAAQYREAIGQ